MINNNSKYPIGVFDSGVGGLSVLKEIVKILPDESVIYYADSGNCPYGTKPQSEIIDRSKRIVDFLIEKKCKLIVVACNTATASAIDFLRKDYDLSFVGMEPAVKPAAINTRSGSIGILATENTFKGRLFNETSKRYASNKNMIVQIGYGLVSLVEEGKIDTVESIELLKKYLKPMLNNKVDQIVLGCTHYPFLMEQIKQIVGAKAEVIDPALPVSIQVYNVLKELDLLNSLKFKPDYTFFTSGSDEILEKMIKRIGMQDYRLYKN